MATLIVYNLNHKSPNSKLNQGHLSVNFHRIYSLIIETLTIPAGEVVAVDWELLRLPAWAALPSPPSLPSRS